MGLGNKCGVLNAFIIVKLFFVWLRMQFTIVNKRDICQWHFQILKRDKKDETMGIRNSKCSKSDFQSQFSILKIILIFLKLILFYFFWWSTFFDNLDFWNIVPRLIVPSEIMSYFMEIIFSTYDIFLKICWFWPEILLTFAHLRRNSITDTSNQRNRNKKTQLAAIYQASRSIWTLWFYKFL